MAALPQVIQDIKGTPGFYYVSNPLAWAVFGSYGKIEVTADGTVYQLNDADVRDGVLDDDGWNPDVMLLTEEQVREQEQDEDGEQHANA